MKKLTTENVHEVQTGDLIFTLNGKQKWLDICIEGPQAGINTTKLKVFAVCLNNAGDGKTKCHPLKTLNELKGSEIDIPVYLANNTTYIQYILNEKEKERYEKKYGKLFLSWKIKGLY